MLLFFQLYHHFLFTVAAIVVVQLDTRTETLFCIVHNEKAFPNNFWFVRCKTAPVA